MEQVVDRVPGYPELGEDHQRRVRIGRLPGERERTLGVERRVADPHVRDRRGHADEPVAVERRESFIRVAIVSGPGNRKTWLAKVRISPLPDAVQELVDAARGAERGARRLAAWSYRS